MQIHMNHLAFWLVYSLLYETSFNILSNRLCICVFLYLEKVTLVGDRVLRQLVYIYKTHLQGSI